MAKSENARGALLMIGSMAAFTLNDTFFKSIAGEVPFFQALLIRGVPVVILMTLGAALTGALRRPIPRRDRGLIALRTFGESAATLTFLLALLHMPIANVTAILQTLPLVLTLVGALLFGESVGWRRSMAIAVGFGGMLLIVKPGSAGFDGYSLLALLAIVFVVIRELSTRRLSPQTPSITVALIGALAVFFIGAAGTLVTGWQPVGRAPVMSLMAASVFIIGGYTLSVMVMRVGEIAVVSPFRYTALLWATGLGWLFFGEVPDRLTILGMTIVALMGVYTFYRERQTAPCLRRES